jgi:hypothetical protein
MQGSPVRMVPKSGFGGDRSGEVVSSRFLERRLWIATVNATKLSAKLAKLVFSLMSYQRWDSFRVTRLNDPHEATGVSAAEFFACGVSWCSPTRSQFPVENFMFRLCIQRARPLGQSRTYLVELSSLERPDGHGYYFQPDPESARSPADTQCNNVVIPGVKSATDLVFVRSACVCGFLPS